MLTRNRITRALFTSLSLAGALAALIAALALPATAQSPGTNLSQLAAQVAALQSTVNSQQTTINNQNVQIQSLQTKVNNDENTIQTLQKTVGDQASSITKLQNNETQDHNAIHTLQVKTASISVQNGVGSNTELFFTGVNVHIVNGLGATDGNPQDPYNNNNDWVVNGLGNLILGYNQTRVPLNFGADQRTGSHNLVLGDANNYASYAGIIGGQINTIGGPYDCVITGDTNSAFAQFASVLGGLGNTASGQWSAILGGGQNTASGDMSAVVGGLFDKATGVRSAVLGGQDSTASGGESIAL